MKGNKSCARKGKGKVKERQLKAMDLRKSQVNRRELRRKLQSEKEKTNL